jgi:hypothetical protein
MSDRVYDSDRVMFLRAFLDQLQHSTSEGLPVDGYFLRSGQDNFGWVDGYGNRFGLICRTMASVEAGGAYVRGGGDGMAGVASLMSPHPAVCWAG